MSIFSKLTWEVSKEDQILAWKNGLGLLMLALFASTLHYVNLCPQVIVICVFRQFSR